MATAVDHLKKDKIRLLQITLCVSVGLMALKFTAAFVTNSNAILTDALESLVNIFAGAFALYSVSLSAKPRDKEHPYGHGKIEFIAAGLEGGLIAFAGLIIIVKATYNIIYPNFIHDLGLGILLTFFAGVVNYIMGTILQKKGKKWNSITMIADGKHLSSDAYTSAGLLIGLLAIILTDIVWLDGVIAILFALILFYSGYKLIRKSIGAFMDEADEQVVEDVVAILKKERNENQIDFHNLRIIKYGANIHIDAHLTLPWYWNLSEVHDELDHVDKTINKHFGVEVELFIHPDPCLPESCKICRKTGCHARQFEFQNEIEWTVENIIENKKHQTYISEQ